MHPVPTKLRLVIPQTYAPVRSIVGRAVSARIADARQASSVYVITVVSMILATVVAQYALWSVLHPGVFAATALAFLAGTLIGFAPRTDIELGSDLRIRRGGEQLALDLAGLGVREISRELYHSHYRRFAQTRSFVRRLTEEKLLVLDAGDGCPVVLELDRHAREAFIGAQAARAADEWRPNVVPLHVEAELASA